MKLFWFKIKHFILNFFGLFKTKKVNVIHDNDVEKLLSSIGELEKVKSSQRSCYSCGREISLNNFGAIYREGGKYHFLCDDYNCLSKFLEHD